jgi:hypothetical protein
MKRFLIKIGIYGFVIFIVLNLISFMCLFFLANSTFYKQQFIKNGINQVSFDYVILGSSTGLTTLDTKQIDSITNKKGLNISMDDSALSSQYLMLQHFYNCGKKTNSLILCVMPGDLETINPKVNGNDNRFIPFIRNDYVYNYFRGIDGENKNVYLLSNYFPLVGLSYFNTELFYPSLVSIFNPSARNRFDDKGNYSYPIDNSNKKFKNAENLIRTIEYKNPYLNKVINFCNENNIKLTLYQSPIYNTKIIFPKTVNIINHSDFLTNPDCFYDRIHVNTKGRELCTKKVVEMYFNENQNTD